MIPAFYWLCWLACRFIRLQCIRGVVVHADRAQRPGGFILASTHHSHLEPFIVGAILRRRIRWMARVEFYRWRWGAAVLRLGGAFPVDRFGNALPAVRKAVALARAGDVVGMFPEGGVAQGACSAMRAGPIKHGACTIAVAARLPIVPVVVLGTHTLNRPAAWVPFRRGRVWVAFGREVLPARGSGSRRADRLDTAHRLEAEFVRTYNDLLARTGLRDTDIP